LTDQIVRVRVLPLFVRRSDIERAGGLTVIAGNVVVAPPSRGDGRVRQQTLRRVMLDLNVVLSKQPRARTSAVSKNII
jgi:hypothetical protein